MKPAMSVLLDLLLLYDTLLVIFLICKAPLHITRRRSITMMKAHNDNNCDLKSHSDKTNCDCKEN